jgi:carboxylesterase type B
MYSKYTLFVSLILSNGFAAAESPRVYDIKHQVTYRGITLDSIEHFQNVRYGHETSGSRRFSPPEPYDPPQGTEVDATLPGHACPQIKDAMLPFFSETETMSEDCLNLRIARPIPSATTSKSKLPVVVWIHGGGVVKGSAYDPHSEPDKLVVLSQSIGKPIIFVAINYRMTAFGFARLPILEEQRSLNVGLRDQREALQWVKDHIEAFGGDPDKITVFGLSAGGTFASLHLMAYGGEQGQ